MLLELCKAFVTKGVNVQFCFCLFYRNDEKTAADYKVQGGSVLHLVLALRGGSVNVLGTHF